MVIFSETIAGVLESLTVTSVAGTAIGNTKVTLSPTLTYGRTYVYKTAPSVTAPALDAVLNDWQVWDGVYQTSQLQAIRLALQKLTCTTMQSLRLCDSNIKGIIKQRGGRNAPSYYRRI